MSLVTQIDLTQADRTERLVMTLALVIAPLILLASFEQQLQGLAALAALLAALACVGIAVQAGWRLRTAAGPQLTGTSTGKASSGRRRRWQLTISAGGAALDASSAGSSDDSGLVDCGRPRLAAALPVRVSAAWRLGGWCWLELECPVQPVPTAPGALAPPVQKVAPGSQAALGAESHSIRGRFPTWGQGASKPRRMAVLLSRRSLSRQWPALLRWIVREQRLGR